MQHLHEVPFLDFLIVHHIYPKAFLLESDSHFGRARRSTHGSANPPARGQNGATNSTNPEGSVESQGGTTAGRGKFRAPLTVPTLSSPSGTQATGPSERGSKLRGSFPGEGRTRETIYATDQKEQSSSGRASNAEAVAKQPGSNGEPASLDGPHAPTLDAGPEPGS